MSNKVLLVRPRNIYNQNNYPPLNLIALSSVLMQHGYAVEIIDCALEEDSIARIACEVKDCLFVGITVSTAEIPDAYRVMKFIKENYDIPIVVGGWHSTLFSGQMANCDYVDYVVVGEGEDHIIEIADGIKKNKEFKKNIFSRKIIDIDKLPLPDYKIDKNIEIFINGYLTDKLSEYVDLPIRWLPYESSRGCPSHCTFCVNVVADNTRYRKKSAKKVADEIETIVKRHELTHLKFIDDNFFVDIKRVREICKAIIEKKLDITWDAECRCDYFNDNHLNDETLELAKKSGLVQITLGLESGSNNTLNLMKKGITTKQGEFAIKKCNDHGIIARCSFIIETPGESLEDIKQTVAFVKKLRKYKYFTCGVQIFRPYPKCELTDNLIAEGYLKEPKNIIEWMDEGVIDLYVSAQCIRPWHVDTQYSEKIAYYLTMESGVSLRPHMLNSKIDFFKYNTFISLAKLRNKFSFYRFTIDKNMYKRFYSSVLENINNRKISERKLA